MRPWLPTFLTIALGAVAAATPDIQAQIVKHPEAGIVFATVYAAIKGILTSPLQPPKQ